MGEIWGYFTSKLPSCAFSSESLALWGGLRLNLLDRDACRLGVFADQKPAIPDQKHHQLSGQHHQWVHIAQVPGDGLADHLRLVLQSWASIYFL